MDPDLYEDFCGTGNIRVLILHPSASDPASPITCSLQQTTFDSGPVYEALSYVWGTDEGLCHILVNGLSFMIGLNLFRALSDLRKVNEKKVLWVDAVCINQEDDEEKLFQIRQMDLVYSRASKVIAYLGRPPEVLIADKDSSLLQEEGHPEFANWACFITTNPYWTRLWIIQEVGLAEILHIQISGLVMTWESLLGQLSRLVQATKGAAIYDQCNQGKFLIQSLAKIRVERNGAMGTLENLIETFQNAKCSNTVDKIYGLMGLANDYNNRSFKQGSAMYGSYNKPRSKVYLETLEHFWAQRLIVCPSGFDRRYDRSMRIMRYSELLLSILEEGFDNDTIRQSTRALQIVARGEVIGTIASNIQQYSSRADIEKYFSSNEILAAMSDPFHQRLSYLKQNIERLTAPDVLKVTKELTPQAQETSIACYGSAKWQPSDFEWDRKDIDAERLRRLRDAPGSTFVPFIASANVGQLFKTADGLYGLGPVNVFEGDVICRFWEMKTQLCVVLRRDRTLKGDLFRVMGRVLLLESNLSSPPDSSKSRSMVIRMGTDMLRFLSV